MSKFDIEEELNAVKKGSIHQSRVAKNDIISAFRALESQQPKEVRAYVIDPEKTDLELFEIASLTDLGFIDQRTASYSLDDFASLLNGTHQDQYKTTFITRFI